MSIRITGLNSGLDTDAMVKELVSAYSKQKDNITKKQTKLEWKQEAWKELNTKIYNFYSSQLSNKRLASAYSMKSTTSSDATKAKVTASNGAVIGTQQLEIKQLAQSAYLTGGEVYSKTGAKITSQSTLADLGVDTSSSVTVTMDGKSHSVVLAASDTIQDVVSRFRDIGLSASFDEGNQRFFLSAKETGASGDFELYKTDGNAAALEALGLTDREGQTATLTGAKVTTNSGANATTSTALSEIGVNGSTEFYVFKDGNRVKVTLEETDTIANALDKFKELGLEASFDEDNQKFVISAKAEGTANEFTVLTEDSNKANMLALGLSTQKMQSVAIVGSKATAADPSETITSNTQFSSFGVSGTQTLRVQIGNEEQQIEINENDTVADVVDKLKALGLNASFDETNQRFVLDSKNFGENVDFKFVKDDNSADLLGKMGVLTADDGGSAVRVTEESGEVAVKTAAKNGGGAVKVAGQDAVIKLNGAEFTSKSNSFSINGLSITAMETTAEGSHINLTTNVDTQGIYDSIKEFFKEYNELIKEMDTLFNADNAKGYEPLTDDEKSELSDKEVEKWEKKIKDSLLRRDSTLNSVADAMKTALAKSYTINGKSYSLANFGISTQSYLSAGKNEKSLYHIDGDKDDSLTKSSPDKLMAAISADPDGASEFFSTLIKGAYEALDKKMKSSSLSSAYVVYNDKQMTKEIKEYDTKLDQWEDKVKYYEDFYYKKFSAMEKAMAQLQSSQNSLSMLLGQ